MQTKLQLTLEQITNIENQVILLVLKFKASKPPEKKDENAVLDPYGDWNPTNEYCAMAHGVMVALVALGYCYNGFPVSPAKIENAGWWLNELRRTAEEQIELIGVEKAISMYEGAVKEAKALFIAGQ